MGSRVRKTDRRLISHTPSPLLPVREYANRGDAHAESSRLVCGRMGSGQGKRRRIHAHSSIRIARDKTNWRETEKQGKKCFDVCERNWWSYWSVMNDREEEWRGRKKGWGCTKAGPRQPFEILQWIWTNRDRIKTKSSWLCHTDQHAVIVQTGHIKRMNT